MSVDLVVPQENVNDPHAILISWLVADGQPVKAGQAVVELETSKAAFEMAAECDGILVHNWALGDEVPVGQVVGRILTESEFASATRAGKPVPAAAVMEVRAVANEEELEPVTAGVAAGAARAAGVRATPGARRLAASLGIDLSSINKRGVIRESDVNEYQKAQDGGPAAPATAPARTRPATAAPAVPHELLAKWRVLDPERLPRGGWLLYSREFIDRILSGGYGALGDRHAQTSALTPIVMTCVAVAQALVWVTAHIPILSSWLETLARVYRRNMFGFFLRGAYYKAKLGYLGPDNIIDQYVEIWGARNVSIGAGCHLDMYARLAAGEESQSQKGMIDIGDHVHVGPQCQLAGRGGITIGSYSAITAGTKIFSATNAGDNPHDPCDLLPMSHAAPPHRQRIYEAPVVVGDHVFVGLNVCILPGVKIGRGAIVNSASVVMRDVPDFAIVGGNPARVQGYRVPKVSA